jgi:metal-responsive CopG/Arc/MetJ family transcriptional regulator
MRTIQMTIDDDLLAAVDRVVKKLNTTRSAFARKALRDAVKKVSVNAPEKKHKKGSRHYPIGKTKSFALDL